MTEQSPDKSAATSVLPTSAPGAVPSPSPLAEAQALSLEVLMSRDPFEMLVEDEKWSKDEGSGQWRHSDGRLRPSDPRNFTEIVAALRRERARWKTAEAQGATRAPKATKAAKVKSTTSLAELGLDD